MASKESQMRWRQKNHAIKRQLNVMARTFVHDSLSHLAEREGLRGKGEAVTFATFMLMALEQHAALNQDVRRLLDLYRSVYQRDRDLYSP
ncbi:hypothetical protein [Pararhodospirillum oryzae]|uniref:Uncharacterized protein n=1 Tax=Pararhodospirillum oryzae TaxID=478448 RepID=A0A512H3D1_9PROT|nr:hypothetical protein [Pararhodospirillum oryzae]GEO79918.1 hypothetical protein ROR02_00490 [Pararhodospirillum oryzae]